MVRLVGVGIWACAGADVGYIVRRLAVDRANDLSVGPFAGESVVISVLDDIIVGIIGAILHMLVP